MKKSNTKNAFIASVASVMLCTAMLAGTSYAWFTDSVSVKVNNIVSGTLDIDLVDADGNSLENTTLDFVKADGADEILWEPGCTYKLEPATIKNNGKLALRYKIKVTGLTGENTARTAADGTKVNLMDAIEWTVKVGNETVDIDTFEGHLKAGETESSAVFELQGHMKETAGNEYQNLTAEGITIQILATQDTAEYDSKDNQYDRTATYPDATAVKSTEELKTAFTNAEDGDVIALTDDLILTEPLTVNKEVTIVGNGQTITGKPITANANVKIENITLEKPENTSNKATLVYAQAGCEELSFDGCTFADPQWEAVQATSNDLKKVSITNCTFTAANVDSDANSSYKSEAGQAIRYIHIQPSTSPNMDITITGNTFKDCGNVADSIVGIYFVGDQSTITVGGNSFEGWGEGDVTEGKTEKLSIGWDSAANDTVLTELKEISRWTGENQTYTFNKADTNA